MAENEPAGIAKRSNWLVNFNGTDAGLMDEVNPALKLVFEPITTGTTGKKNILGHRFVGVSGTIKLQCRQMSDALYALFAPWHDGNGPLPLTPPANSDLYDFAKPLILHPDDAGEDTSQDLVFPKASPMSVPAAIKKDGGKDDTWEVELAVYPPREQMAANPRNISVGYIGQE